MTKTSLNPEVMHRWQRRARWFALGWLFYLVYPLGQLMVSPHITVTQRWIGLAGTVAFVGGYVAFYFRTEWPSPRYIVLTAASFAALGTFLVWRVNLDFASLFVYAGIVAAAVDNLTWFLELVSAVVLVGLGVTVFRGDSWQTALFTFAPTVLIMCLMYGFYQYIAVTIKLGRAESEIRRMAEAETRMRITQDLHDVLGQSLATIVLQADLAARTPEVTSDDMTAIADLARQALRELRQVVQGTHLLTLTEAISQARVALAVAHVAVEVPVSIPTVVPEIDPVLAMVLRESVTNVIRHSRAEHCVIDVLRDKNQVTLSVEDDGVGHCDSTKPLGFGLEGIVRRVETMGGHMEMGTSSRLGGWCIRVQLPESAL